MTTGWGRALMKTPLVGQAVGMFAKGYAGIVGAELKKCAPPPARTPPALPLAAAAAGRCARQLARWMQLEPASAPGARVVNLRRVTHRAVLNRAQTVCGTRT